MPEYAPQAIFDLFARVHDEIPSAVLSGILGDQAHTFGYHRCRNVLPTGDYSRQLLADMGGDGYAAAALDVSLSPTLMVAVTGRLLAAAKANDPRLRALREFCGTTDGSVTHNYDLSNGYEGFGEWDDSHLWHVHLSLYRRYANDAAALAPIADVMAGKFDSGDWFDMATKADLQAVLDDRLGWWLPRFGSVLRGGKLNRAFTSKNTGPDLLDGKGLDGTAATKADVDGLEAQILSLTLAVKALQPPATS